MIKDYETNIREFTRLLDIGAILASFYLSFYIRDSQSFALVAHKYLGGILAFTITDNFELPVYEKYLWFIIPLWLILLTYGRTYLFSRIETFSHVFLNLLKVHIIGGFILSAFLLLPYSQDFKRSFFLLFILISLILTTAIRFIFMMLFEFFRSHGKLSNHAIILGTGKNVERLLKELNDHPYWGFRIIGILTPSGDESDKLSSLAHLGTLDDLSNVLRKETVDDVFVISDGKAHSELNSTLKICESIGVNVHLIPNKYDLSIARSTIGTMGKLEFITFSSTPADLAPRLAKRTIDILVSITLLPLLLITTIVVAILIKSESHGQVFYKSIRITRNRRPFAFYKFRTMFENAEQTKKELEEKNQMSGPISKIKDDPRVTKIGKLLRKYSIDELPQIVNVLKGDMSLVGPRPPTPSEVDLYEFQQLRKLSMLQGMTGLWQVMGRDDINDFDERLKLDLKYIDSWSLGLDFKILLKTIRVVFKGAM